MGKTMKCRVCLKRKPVGAFYDSRKTCTLCYQQKSTTSRYANPVRYRAVRMRSSIKQRCCKKGWVFDENITTDWLEAQMQATPQCPCCWKPFSVEFDGDTTHSPSVDRLDSSKPYRFEDLRIICNRCNKLKSNGTLQELEDIVRWMRNELIKGGYHV